MNDCLGGSELTYKKLIQRITPNLLEDIDIVLNCNKKLNLNKKVLINWQQLSYDQPCLEKLKKERYNYYVFVSNWQYEKFRYFKEKYFDKNNSIIIKNAVESVPYIEKPRTKKYKLIYTSTPWRGLSVLLKSFSLLNRDDIELHIFSSTIIYGKKYDDDCGDEYEILYNIARSMKNVKYHGFASNDEVLDAVKESHIFSYPNTWEETSCMSALESAMSGCDLVTTNYGALYETLGDWSSYVNYNSDLNKLALNFAKQLNKNIDNFWKEETQERLYEQHKYFKRHYSWDVRIKEWESFLKSISPIKQKKPPKFSFM